MDVLLDDGEPDAAWQVATKNPSWEPGDRRWMRLAEGRAPGHPSDALKVYLRLADVELETDWPGSLCAGYGDSQEGGKLRNQCPQDRRVCSSHADSARQAPSPPNFDSDARQGGPGLNLRRADPTGNVVAALLSV